jgi:amino acid permease
MFSLIYLLIWFLTCKQIWRYGVLMNLIIVAFQLFSIFNPSFSHTFDEHELYYSFPFVVPLVLLLFFLFTVVNYQTKIKKADEQIELEILKIIEKHQSSILNEPFASRLKQLFAEKQYLDKKAYEQKLVALRETLSMELKVLQNKSLY